MKYLRVLVLLAFLPLAILGTPQASANYRIVSTASDTWPAGANTYGLVSGVKLADVDGDGSVELLTAGTSYNGSSRGELRIYHKSDTLVLEGSQFWTIPGSGSVYLSAVEAGDIDGDGFTETVVVGNSQEFGSRSHIGIYRWTGTSLIKERLYNFTGPSFSIETRGVAIWSKTGVNHIVTIGYYSTGSGISYSQLGIWSWDNSVLTRKALYNWTATGGGGAGTQGYGVATGDVDMDGTPDIITVGYSFNSTTYSNQLRVWNWDGSSLNPKQTREWSNGQYSIARSVSLKDLDNDGSPEIIVGGQNYDSPFLKGELSVWSDSSGSLAQLYLTDWLTSSTLSTEDQAVVSAADVDLDGSQEIVTAGYTNIVPGGNYGTIAAWSWTGSSASVEKSYRSSTTDTRFMALAIGDLDADGKPDLIVAGQRLGKSILEVRNVAFVYSSIQMSVSPSPAIAGQSVTVSGTLTNQTDGNALGESQILMEYSKDGGSYQLLATVTADSQGRFASSFTPSGPGSYTIKVAWAGDEEHMGTTTTAALTINKAPSVITLSSSSFNAKPGDTITVGGYLYPASAGTISIIYTSPSGGVTTHVVASDSTGRFSDQTTVDSAGEWQVTASWAGTVDTAGTSSNTVRVQAQPEPVGVTLSPYGFGAALLALGLAVFALTRKGRASPAQTIIAPSALQPPVPKTNPAATVQTASSSPTQTASPSPATDPGEAKKQN